MNQHFVKVSLCVSTFCQGVLVCINILLRCCCVYQHFVKASLCVSTFSFCKDVVVCVNICQGVVACINILSRLHCWDWRFVDASLCDSAFFYGLHCFIIILIECFTEHVLFTNK